MIEDSTIVAIATAPGKGGIGIVRLSGKLSYSIGLQLTQKSTLNPRVGHYCSFHFQQAILDQGLILYFPAPYSFTGEEVVELHAHGSPIVLDALVEACIHLGARLAKPGEFSLRGFLNNKFDLTQAEAIADLINASSRKAAQLALSSLQGEFSTKIHHINEQIIYLRTFVEATIDFPEEEIDNLAFEQIEIKLQKIITDLSQLQKSCKQGALLREGFTLLIMGKPNVGKSTLMNYLAGHEIAIVTEIAGTTRDIIRETILIDDLPVKCIDTAGLRDSTDVVEQEGIRRAWQEMARADAILWLKEINDSEEDNATESIRTRLPASIPILEVKNKMDTCISHPSIQGEEIYISAKTGLGIDNLKEQIKKLAGFEQTEGLYLARRRHIDALLRTFTNLHQGKQALHLKALELVAEELRQAHLALNEITGTFTTEDLLGSIFSTFCIGK